MVYEPIHGVRVINRAQKNPSRSSWETSEKVTLFDEKKLYIELCNRFSELMDWSTLFERGASAYKMLFLIYILWTSTGTVNWVNNKHFFLSIPFRNDISSSQPYSFPAAKYRFRSRVMSGYVLGWVVKLLCIGSFGVRFQSRNPLLEVGS